MVKGALLMCKTLQSHKKATSSDYALFYSFANVMQFHNL